MKSQGLFRLSWLFLATRLTTASYSLAPASDVRGPIIGNIPKLPYESKRGSSFMSPLHTRRIDEIEGLRADLKRSRDQCEELRCALAKAQCRGQCLTTPKSLEKRAISKLVARVNNGGGGTSTAPVAGDYCSTSIRSLILNRGGWLAVFLLSLFMTTFVMNGFEHTLEKHIELALFVPLLIGHGGNAGGQTVGTVLGAMSAGQVSVDDWAKVIAKESLAGLGAGSLTDIAVLPLLMSMRISKHVSAAILVTLPVLTVLASALGAGLPFLVSALGQDPAVIAAPAMTTLVDVGGLLSYFLIANVVFSAFGMQM
jgi:cation transporter-like permease